MKRPLIALGISAAMILVGSAVCMPGICGCISWLGIPDTEFSELFLFVWMGGGIGVGLSLIWLTSSVVLQAWRR